MMTREDDDKRGRMVTRVRTMMMMRVMTMTRVRMMEEGDLGRWIEIENANKRDLQGLKCGSSEREVPETNQGTLSENGDESGDDDESEDDDGRGR